MSVRIALLACRVDVALPSLWPGLSLISSSHCYCCFAIIVIIAHCLSQFL